MPFHTPNSICLEKHRRRRNSGGGFIGDAELVRCTHVPKELYSVMMTAAVIMMSTVLPNDDHPVLSCMYEYYYYVQPYCHRHDYGLLTTLPTSHSSINDFPLGSL